MAAETRETFEDMAAEAKAETAQAKKLETPVIKKTAK